MHAEPRFIGNSNYTLSILAKQSSSFISGEALICCIDANESEKDEAYFQSLSGLLSLNSSCLIEEINSRSTYWDILNCAFFLSCKDNLRLIRQINNSHILLATALMVFNDPGLNREKDFTVVLEQLSKNDSQMMDDLIRHCETCGKFIDYLVYILNNTSAAFQIDVVMCLSFEYTMINNELEKQKYRMFDEKLKTISEESIYNVSKNVKEKWDAFIIELISEKSAFGQLMLSRYSNFILRCLSIYYRDSIDDYIRDLTEVLNKYEFCLNDWYYPNHSFMGPYFAIATKFYYLRLVNEENNIVCKENNPELYDQIHRFYTSQFRCLSFWKSSKLDYNEYLKF